MTKTFVKPDEFRELLDQILGQPCARASLPLPPSSNNIYFTRREGGRTMRILTTEARSWKTRAVQEIVKQGKLAIQDKFDPFGLYWLVLHFRFEKVINDKWNEFYVRGPKTGQRKGQLKWVRMDNDNRVKLAADAMRNATGVDDSANFAHILLKDCDPEHPGMEILLYELEDIYG